jgi:putative DNA primase/helicase
VYKNGVYGSDGEKHIKRRVKELLLAWGEEARWRTTVAKETLEFIGVDAPALLERPHKQLLNVRNGLLNLETGVLHPHSPDFLSPIQIPVDFDPAAACPETEKFLADVLPADCTDLYFEIAAWLVAGIEDIQKAVLLVGEGENGKSALLAAMIAFIGKANISSVSLHKLEADRFAVARLVGKVANICADLPSAHLAGTSIFKALTGGDELEAERKFHESFPFRPFARLVFSSNNPPRSQDSTHGFFRRWLVVPFNQTFTGTRKLPRSVLDARLADRRELSGVLNRALAVLPRLRADGIKEAPSMKAAWNEFREVTDPLAVWLDRETVLVADAMIPKEHLRRAYERDCTKRGAAPESEKAFGSAIKRIMPNVKDAQRTRDGKPNTWVYLGITLRADSDNDINGINGINPNLCTPEMKAKKNKYRENPVDPVEPVGLKPCSACQALTRHENGACVECESPTP